MLTISIDPVAFTVGSLTVRWYGIAIAVALVVLLLIMVREAKSLGIKRDLYGLFLWCVFGGLIGGRIAYIIYDWEYFIANPLAIFSFQGLAQNGMLIGVITVAFIYMGVTKMRLSTLLSIGDAVAVGMPLAIAIGRIGCTINGCCYGQVSPFDSFPLAMIYTARDTVPAQYWGVPLYPTPIYHLIWGLIVFGIVWGLRGRFKPEGGLLFFCLCLFAIGDFAIRFARTDEPVFWGLRQAQILDLAILAVFLSWFIIRLRRFQKQALVTELTNEVEPGQSRED